MTPYETVELIANGVKARGPTPASFAWNLHWFEDAWRVRLGFGQLAEFDTSMLQARTTFDSDDDFGYTKHLGSRLINTNFGHTQILSVLLMTANPGSSADKGNFQRLIGVSIYDVTTNQRWEEVLHYRTAQSGLRTSMPDLHGTYATNRIEDYQAWIEGTDDEVFFTELNDTLFFGSKSIGTWAYLPSIFRSDSTRATLEPRSRQLDSWSTLGSTPGYEESAIIVPITAADGIFTDAYAYLNKSEFPRAQVVAAINGRLAYADGRTVFFTDPPRADGSPLPASIVSDNVISITDSKTEITAMAELNGNLYIFTEDESYFFRTPNSRLLSSGRLFQISSSVGCSGPNAVTKMGNTLVWCDSNGVHTNRGDLEVVTISDDIQPFFTGQIVNPMTSFYVADGYSSHSATLRPYPQSALRFEPGQINVHWSYPQRALFVSLPGCNLMLVWAEGKWAFWSTESRVRQSGGSAVVGGQDYLKSPWLVGDEERMFLVGGIDKDTVIDAIATGGGSDQDDDTSASSYFICEYGRGGGIDRNVEYEDSRLVKEYWVHEDPGTTSQKDRMIVLGKPINVGPDTFTFPNGTVAGANTFLLPIFIVVDLADTLVDDIEISFRFDNGEFTPVTIGATAELDLVLPPERWFSRLGWSINNGGATSEARVYNTGFSATDANGPGIRLKFDGNLGTIPGGTWTLQPNLNLPPGRPQLLCYVGLQTDSAADTKVGFGLEAVTAQYTEAVATRTCSFYLWRQTIADTTTGDDSTQRVADSVAQCVDWAYLSDEIRSKDMRALFRGVDCRIKSHGKGNANDVLVANWPWGMFNSVASVDERGWTGQNIDYDGAGDQTGAIVRIDDRHTVRYRVVDSTSSLRQPTFDNTLRWGDSSSKANNDAVTDSVLIGDEQYSFIRLSDDVQGESFRVMFHGYVQNKAEALVLDSAMALIRARPNSRRRQGFPSFSTDGTGAP